MTHPCPRCGKITEGAYSQGGLKWAICDDCMGASRSWERHQKEVAAEHAVANEELLQTLSDAAVEIANLDSPENPVVQRIREVISGFET